MLKSVKKHHPSAVPVLAGALFLGAAQAASAVDSGGSLLGWVEDSRGTPVPGALVSLFGRGMRAAAS